MVGTSASGGDQLVADGAGKRKICEGATSTTGVNMPDLPAPDTKLNTAEAVLGDLDARPRTHFRDQRFHDGRSRYLCVTFRHDHDSRLACWVSSTVRRMLSAGIGRAHQ